MSARRPWYRRFHRGWITSGGSGFSGVKTDPTLTGNGLTATPLGVKGWPLTFFSFGVAGGSSPGSGANNVDCSGFMLPCELTFSNLVISVGMADALHSYDFGIYTKAGALLANCGAQSPAGTGFTVYPVLQAPVTISPGLYLFCWTGTDNLLNIYQAGTSQVPWIQKNAITTSVGGVLPATVPAQVVTFTVNNHWYFSLY